MAEFWNQYQDWIVGSIIVLAFLFVLWKGKALKDAAIGIKDFFVKLYEMIFLGIEDRETYDKNKEQREADEEYKRNMKNK